MFSNLSSIQGEGNIITGYGAKSLGRAAKHLNFDLKNIPKPKSVHFVKRQPKCNVGG